jgi:hypothetical protein
VSALAFGDVDGDGDDELALGRNAGPNMRFEVHDLDPATGTWNVIVDEGGSGWGDDRGVSALAFGDVDGDGDDELALGRTAGANMRFEVHDFDPATHAVTVLVDEGGDGWGDDRGVTALALPDTAHDTDGDWLPDCVERAGWDATGDGTVDVNLAAMGADPLRIDVFVEIDCLVDEALGGTLGHSHCPTRQALRQAVATFASAPVRNPDGRLGIQLHLDTGTLFGSGVEAVPGADGAVGSFGNLGGGNAILEMNNEIVDLDGAVGDPGTDVDAIRDANFDSDRRRVFRYALFGHQTNFRRPVNDCTSGRSADPDLIVTLGGLSTGGFPCWATDANGFSVGSDDEQAGTFVHELGHTLELAHGGFDDGTNNKPNYLSVMNYLFQQCDVPPSPTPGIPGGCDYSRTALPDLDETALDECAGIDGGSLGYGPMDWDGDLTFEGPSCAVPTAAVAADVNGDGRNTVLAGREDWTRLEYEIEPRDGDAGDGGVDPEELAAARAHLGARLRPDLVVTIAPVAGQPGQVRVDVANRGGGPALGTRLTVVDPPTSAPVPLGAVPAGGSVQRTIAVAAPPRCGGAVAVVVTATDFVRSPVTVKERHRVGPVCPSPVDELTGSVDVGPSPVDGLTGSVDGGTERPTALAPRS